MFVSPEGFEYQHEHKVMKKPREPGDIRPGGVPSPSSCSQTSLDPESAHLSGKKTFNLTVI